MKSRDNRCVTSATTATTTALARLIVVLAITCGFYSQALAQTTAADTPISNTASASYSDGSGGSYNTTSNTVTVTVSKVSGLTITPDVTNGSSDPTGSEPAEDPLTVENMATTVYRCLGINADKRLMAPGTRPIDLVRGGTVMKDLLA